MNTTTPAQAKETATVKNKPKICDILILGNQGVPFSPLGGSSFSREGASATMLALRSPTCALLESPGSGIKPPPKCTLCDNGGRICTAAHLLTDCNGKAGLRKPGALPTRCML